MIFWETNSVRVGPLDLVVAAAVVIGYHNFPSAFGGLFPDNSSGREVPTCTLVVAVLVGALGEPPHADSRADVGW